MNGDTVFIHYICRDEDGNVVDDSAESEDHPVSFEVGAGEITGNPLFQAFDEAIRGLPLGSTTVLEARGGDWNRELFFEVCHDAFSICTVCIPDSDVDNVTSCLIQTQCKVHLMFVAGAKRSCRDPAAGREVQEPGGSPRRADCGALERRFGNGCCSDR